MDKYSERIQRILQEHQEKCKKNQLLQDAIRKYIDKHDLIMPTNIDYGFGIDFFDVWVKGEQVLIIGLPPNSNYEVFSTEHTSKYLKKRAKIA